MIKKFKQFINDIEYLKYLKESEEYTKYIPFPDSDKKILQSKFNLGSLIIAKTVKDAIWAISKYGYFYILVGQILKDNKRDPKTDETLTKIKNVEIVITLTMALVI